MCGKVSSKRLTTAGEGEGPPDGQPEDSAIDLSDIPELSPEAFARGVVREGLGPPRRKRQVTLRLDADVIDWFRRSGPGYQTRINQLLRAYMEAHDKE